MRCSRTASDNGPGAAAAGGGAGGGGAGAGAGGGGATVAGGGAWTQATSKPDNNTAATFPIMALLLL